MSDSLKQIIFPNAELHYGVILNEQESHYYFQKLNTEIEWKQGEIILFGKKVLEPRLSAWYGDEGASYTYSGKFNIPLPWTKTVLELKTKVEDVAKCSFNSVLLNFYRGGNDSMGWHSDDEPELGKNPIIASLSLGEGREFHLKHKFEKSFPIQKIFLENGSLLLMKGETQHFWKHQVPKSKRAIGGRINLTFRRIML